MRTFIPQNLNCDSSPFRQHFQAGVKKFLIRIRDGCLAYVRGQKGKKKGESSHSKRTQDLLDQGIGEKIIYHTVYVVFFERDLSSSPFLSLDYTRVALHASQFKIIPI